MRDLIKYCYEHNLNLSHYVRAFLKDRPKEPLTGIYKGN